MNKQLIIKLLTNTSIDMNDLNTFISEYVHEALHRDVTIEELKGIAQLVQMGVFNIRIALLHAARHKNLQVLDVFNKSNERIRTIVYEV